ncbi:uncharacterized protein LOC111081555 [Drosophila obscura]|uniref:uncharacterized protein LOC111081555 n=1 Tax=Drosophila obscura TaxID=7282 RepID=UPI001BB0DDEA|nr:uncharacterized protein LOC111081555 [Drosophila obscura]
MFAAFLAVKITLSTANRFVHIMASSLQKMLLSMNIVHASVSLVVIVCGISFFIDEVSNLEKVAGGLTIAQGVLGLLLSKFCRGAAGSESPDCLKNYVAIAMLQIFSQLLLLYEAANSSALIGKTFDDLWEADRRGAALERRLEFYEKFLKCCGVNGTNDYSKISLDPPKSCCIDGDSEFDSPLHPYGCKSQFTDYVFSKLLLLKLACWLLIIVGTNGALCGWRLYRIMKRQIQRESGDWMDETSKEI